LEELKKRRNSFYQKAYTEKRNGRKNDVERKKLDLKWLRASKGIGER
jgi:hypothetical protein